MSTIHGLPGRYFQTTDGQTTDGQTTDGQTTNGQATDEKSHITTLFTASAESRKKKRRSIYLIAGKGYRFIFIVPFTTRRIHLFLAMRPVPCQILI